MDRPTRFNSLTGPGRWAGLFRSLAFSNGGAVGQFSATLPNSMFADGSSCHAPLGFLETSNEHFSASLAGLLTTSVLYFPSFALGLDFSLSFI